jgi:hypothetical protein
MKDIKASGFYKTKEEQGVTKYNKGGMADYIKDLL